MKDKYYYFNLGAQAMQTKIAAHLMVKNMFDLAPKILELEPPNFQEPEEVTIKEVTR